MRWTTLGALSLMLAGCVDARVWPDLPREAWCLEYASYMGSADSDVAPSIVPAPGAQIVVDSDFWPFTGTAHPVPGGWTVSDVSIFRWYDGDHLGAIGRVVETGMCRWFDAHATE